MCGNCTFPLALCVRKRYILITEADKTAAARRRSISERGVGKAPEAPMSALSFPSEGSALAARIDPAHIAACAAQRHRLPSLPEAKLRYSRQIRESAGAIWRIEGVVILADDTLALVSVGIRGGHKIEWRF